MLILNVSKINKNFGYGNLFENLSFSLNEGQRISIVGKNGCGKSTLLNIIAGIEKCDGGSVSIKKGAKVAYLAQTLPDVHDERIVEDILKEAYVDLLAIQNKIDDILQKINETEDPLEYDKLINLYGNFQEEFQNNGGYEIETNIDIVCNGLNISAQIRSQKYDKLSGGEKTLVHLAKALLQKPDLFLLDEPTNHLDINRIEWLESYIKIFKGAMIIVSHDRSFLDNLSNMILELDNETGVVYNTNYSGYLLEKEQNFQKQMSDYKTQQAYFKKLENQAKRFAQIGMATNSTAMTKKASVLFKRIEKEKAKRLIKQPKNKQKIKMKFIEPKSESKRVIELKDVSIFAAKRKIIENVNLYLGVGEHIAIIGDNGSGKSSIIKTILNEQTLPWSGDIIISPSAKIGYLPQSINFKNGKQTVFEYFQSQICQNEQKVRAILSKFQFNQRDVAKLIGSLSGGERIRLRLAILLQQQVNCLIFDEPTNHIDIPTRESMEKAIEDFKGSLLFVSHDRYFINKFAEKVVKINQGKAELYIGNYEDYRQKVKDNE